MATTLTSCDLEPITRLEQIQQFAVLLAVTSTGLVRRASANASRLIGFKHDISGGSIHDWFDAKALERLNRAARHLRAHGGVQRLYNVALVRGRSSYDITLHYSGGLLVLEVEAAGAESRLDTLALVRSLIGRLSKEPSLHSFHQLTARAVRTLIGYDRVMIYRFSSDGSGEVIAQATAAETDSLLGLHYPASDIPTQARALYLRNTFRIVADVHASTIPLSPSPTKCDRLDLSFAVSRAVSPIHIEYLINMAVAASVSLSIVVDGALWGLITCHNGTPSLPSLIVRSAAELFGQMYSMALEDRLRPIQENRDHGNAQTIGILMGALVADKRRLGDIEWLRSELGKLIPCDGLAARTRGISRVAGNVPSEAQLADLEQTLDLSSASPIFATDDFLQATALSSVHPSVTGLMVIPIPLDPGDYFMLFRMEWIRSIRWAGESVKNLASETNVDASTPRKSFAECPQIIYGRSQPFLVSERQTACILRTAFIKHYSTSAGAYAEEQRLTTRRQIAWVSSMHHRAGTLVALIQGLIGEVQGPEGRSASYVDSMSGRMQALARAHDQMIASSAWESSITTLFDNEIAATGPAQLDAITLKGPLVTLPPDPFLALALLIHELVTGITQRGTLSSGGRVEASIDHWPEGECRFIWREIGGPPAVLPVHPGFNFAILQHSMAKTTIVYPPSGMEAEFRFSKNVQVSHQLQDAAHL